MKKILPAIILFIFCTQLVSAQEPAASSVFIPTDGEPSTFRLLNNTANGTVLMLYRRYNSGNTQNALALRVLTSAQLMTTEKVISTDVGTFDAVWHPQANRFMLVFTKGTSLYAVAIGATGTIMSPITPLGTVNFSWPRVAPALKRKFIVYFGRNYGKDPVLLAISLRNNAKKFRGPKELKTFTAAGTVQLFGAAQEASGMSVVYCLNKIASATSAPFHVVRAEPKLKSKNITSFSPFNIPTQQQYNTNALTVYHAASRTHMVFWKESYCVFDESGTKVFGPSAHNQGEYMHSLCIDPTSGRIALLRVARTTSSPWKADFYHTTYNELGTKLSGPTLLFTDTAHDVFGVDMAYFSNGKYLVMWYYDYTGMRNYYGNIY